jgi:hypothetical protein
LRQAPAGGGNGEKEKDCGKPRPDSAAPSACPLRAAEDVVGAETDEAGEYLGKTEVLAVGGLAQIGARLLPSGALAVGLCCRRGSRTRARFSLKM